MGHYETLRTEKFGTNHDLYLVLKAKLMHKKSTEEVTIIGIPPITIISNGNNATVGLKGNTVQSGTPTPDNPIMPEGTGERTGNLFSSVWEQGSINGTTGQNEQSSLRVRTAEYIEVSTNKIYSFLRSVYNQYMNVRFYSADKSFVGTGSTSTIRLIAGSAVGNPMYAGDKFCCFEIIDPNIKYMRISDQSNNLSTRYMMVEGEYTEQTMPEYEPYGYKIPISSASTTTPVYLGEVETTRKIGKLVLTGEENITSGHLDVNLFNIPVSDYLKQSAIICISTHYISQSNVNGWADVNDKSATFYGNTGSATKTMYIRDSAYTTVADFKAYLAAQYAAGTPVTVWYVLATEETGIVNEPLMKIGDYADEISDIIIPTIKGTNIVDVDTEVKPSEISITYTKGKEININNISDMEKLTIADLEKMTIAELEG